MINIPFFLTLYAGFIHAFETDHVLAVTNIVSNRTKILKAIKDGAFWGLGHTSTILIIGLVVLFLKLQIKEAQFKYFEALVGLMLILLGIYRIKKWYKKKSPKIHAHLHTHLNEEHKHIHVHTIDNVTHNHSHIPAYSVGLVHGLAGSGSLLIVIMAQMKNAFSGISYLLLFGLGSIFGMMLVAGLFSLPFSKKILASKFLQTFLIFLSATLCIIYGSWVMYKNLV